MLRHTKRALSGKIKVTTANANKFTFVWRRSVERYSSNLIEKSNLMYDELLEKEIIPAIEHCLIEKTLLHMHSLVEQLYAGYKLLARPLNHVLVLYIF